MSINRAFQNTNKEGLTPLGSKVTTRRCRGRNSAVKLFNDASPHPVPPKKTSTETAIEHRSAHYPTGSSPVTFHTNQFFENCRIGRFAPAPIFPSLGVHPLSTIDGFVPPCQSSYQPIFWPSYRLLGLVVVIVGGY